MKKIAACKVGELAPNGIKQVEVPDHQPVAVYNLDGEFFCIDDVCTHGMAFLSDGEVDGTDIVCPWHEGTFDIKTGKATGAPCTIPLKTYKCVVEGDTVYIEIPEE
jgi:nitrite reductase/ring-hydroxylating ferredoxin subunit